MPSLRILAQNIAEEAHRGQTRKDGKTPYFSHVQAVAWKLSNESDEVYATTWLHDVLEDTKVTLEELETKGNYDHPKSSILHS